MARKDSNLTMCSFCGKNHAEVKKLIAGPDVYICDSCIGVCAGILESERFAASQGHFTIKDIAVVCHHCNNSEFFAGSSPFIANFAPHPTASGNAFTLLNCTRCGHVQIFSGSHQSDKKEEVRDPKATKRNA